MTNEWEGLVGEHEPEVHRPPHRDPLSDCVRPGRASQRVLEPEVVVRRMPNGRVLLHGRFLVEVTLHRHLPQRGGPIWVASATLETRSGPMQWSASVTEQEIARRLAAQLGLGVEQAIAGFAPKGRGHAVNAQAVRRGAQDNAFRRVIGDVRRTLDKPAAQTVLNATAAIPYVGPALQGVRAATTLVDNVANGDRGSRARLERLQRAARRGDPNARQAVGVVERVLRSQRRVATARAAARSRAVRGSSPVVDRAWRHAHVRWNEWRAARAREGVVLADPPIPPPPRRREP